MVNKGPAGVYEKSIYYIKGVVQTDMVSNIWLTILHPN